MNNELELIKKFQEDGDTSVLPLLIEMCTPWVVEEIEYALSELINRYRKDAQIELIRYLPAILRRYDIDYYGEDKLKLRTQSELRYFLSNFLWFLNDKRQTRMSKLNHEIHLVPKKAFADPEEVIRATVVLQMPILSADLWNKLFAIPGDVLPAPLMAKAIDPKDADEAGEAPYTQNTWGHLLRSRSCASISNLFIEQRDYNMPGSVLKFYEKNDEFEVRVGHARDLQVLGLIQYLEQWHDTHHAIFFVR